MQALHHAAVALGEFEEAPGERSGDAERVRHLTRIEPQEMAAGDRRAERPGGARCVKAARLVGVPGGAADADHDFVAGDKGGDQSPAAKGLTTVDTLLLRHGERRRQHCRAGMRAGPRPGQGVELEGVRQGAVGERRRGCLHRAAGPQDAARAPRPGALGILDDDPAPRQRAAADGGRHRVDDALFGAGDHIRRKILIAQTGGIFGELHRCSCHPVPPKTTMSPVGVEISEA